MGLFKRKHDSVESEGRDARVRAEAALEQAKAQRASVHKVSESLQKQTSDNDFVGRISAMIQGG